MIWVEYARGNVFSPPFPKRNGMQENGKRFSGGGGFMEPVASGAGAKHGKRREKVRVRGEDARLQKKRLPRPQAIGQRGTLAGLVPEGG